MVPQKSKISALEKAYNVTVTSLKNNRLLFIPFLIFFIFDFISLIVIYLAPRMPVSLVLGPIIRTLWGEKFLHYPLNFILLPQLTSFSRMALGVVFGSLLTGIAINLVFDIYNKKQLSFKTSLVIALKRYFELFTVVLIFTLVFYILQKILMLGIVKYFVAGHRRLLFLGPNIWLGPLLLALNFLLATIIQAAFIYAIPVIIIEKEKLFKSLIKSFVLFKKSFFSTVILVGLPMLIYVPIVILESKTDFMITRLFPESVLLLLILGCAVSAFAIDLIVTVSTTYFYLIKTSERLSEKNT